MSTILTAHWWQPGEPAKSLPGILFEDEEDGWLLQLDGSFQESIWTEAAKTPGTPINVSLDIPPEFPILVGTTSQGQLVSLFHCQVRKASPPLFSRGALTLWPTIVAYDVHFEGLDDFRLTRLSIRYSNLDAWVATSGFSVQFGPKLYPVEIKYSKPESIDVGLPTGLTIGVGFSASGPKMPAMTEIQILQQSWLTTTSTQDLPYEHLLTHLTNLANLISLGVGAPLRPLEMNATCNARDALASGISPISIKLIDNRKPIAPASRQLNAWDMLFTFPEIRERFAQLVLSWFSRDDKLQSLYDLYFGTVRSPWMYVEQRFLNMFQALESYDRRSFEHLPEEQQKHRERLNRIFSTVESLDQKWLKGKLRYSHEPAAADRIRRLVEQLDAQWLLSDADITLAGNLRIYYTHFDPAVEERLPARDKRPQKMHNLAVRLQILCELQLLVACGMPIDYVRERMATTQRVERRLVAEMTPI